MAIKYKTPLIPATFVRRYKRFFVDAELADGTGIVAHCPNTGSMRGCIGEGWQILLSPADNPNRKLKYTLEAAYTPEGDWIGLNTGLANKVVEAALLNKQVASLGHYTELRREVKYGEQNSRIDFLLSADGYPDCYLEVKSVTLLEQGQGYFPDAVSTRGQKHLQELIHMVQSGHKAVLFFLIQHQGINSVRAAAHIDPVYAQLLDQAVSAGVQIIAAKAKWSGEKLFVDQIVSDTDA